MSLQYNTKDSSVRLAYEAQPRPKAITSLAGETIVKVACGTNHTGYHNACPLSLPPFRWLLYVCFLSAICVVIVCLILLFVLGIQWQWMQMAMFIRKGFYMALPLSCFQIFWYLNVCLTCNNLWWNSGGALVVMEGQYSLFIPKHLFLFVLNF